MGLFDAYRAGAWARIKGSRGQGQGQVSLILFHLTLTLARLMIRNMYEYLKGKLVASFPGKATVEVNGLGYALLMPLNNYPKLPQVGKEILLYLALIVREDAHTLFAFLTRSERELFNRLTQVSGIGPKTALALVGHMEASDLQIAISQGNLSVLCKVPGIGKKTAERLIVDLRDSFKKTPQLESQPSEGISSDALNALIHLGYHPLQAQKAIHAAIQKTSIELDLPQLITEALRAFNG